MLSEAFVKLFPQIPLLRTDTPDSAGVKISQYIKNIEKENE